MKMTNLYDKRIQGLKALKNQLQLTAKLIDRLIDLETRIQELEKTKK